jgi:oligopeptide/dipeptide ABC transporter ATP-binding protein
MTEYSSVVLSVRDLVVEVETPEGARVAVEGVSFDVLRDEVLCIVGESGSGKSLTMLAAMGLLPEGAHVTGGSITYGDQDLLHLDGRQRRRLMGSHFAMVFQDSMTSLNPVARIGRQIEEMIRSHDRSLGRAARRSRALELLRSVHLPDAERVLRSHPHELSGGMRQRVMIAMAMAHSPALLIADEPTTALDVTVQAQILRLFEEVRAGAGSSLCLITHDLAVVASIAHRVIVMYSGRILEQGEVSQVLERPHHPYTVGLVESAQALEGGAGEIHLIPGNAPSLASKPPGCAFHPRCQLGCARERCQSELPQLHLVEPRHASACHFSDEVPAWAAIRADERAAAEPFTSELLGGDGV